MQLNPLLKFTLVLGVIGTLGLFDSGCRKQDVRTVTINTPGMKDNECARIIQDAFMRYPGIKTAHPDVEKRQVKVSYNSMVIAIKNIEFIIANAGFQANEIPANTNVAVKLPIGDR